MRHRENCCKMYTTTKKSRIVQRIGALMAFVPTIGWGQEFAQLNQTLENVAKLLQGAGVAVVTVAIVWAGYKMVFQHSRWSDVSTVVLGAIFIGAAGSIATWLVRQ